MTTLLFDAAEVKHLIEHARGATKFWPTYAGMECPQEPCLMLVHDGGSIYLISNGIPGLSPLDGSSGHRAIYADGYNCEAVAPHTYGDGTQGWEEWNRVRDAGIAAVGGDDFAEWLKLTDKDLVASEHATQFCVEVSADTIAWYWKGAK